MKTKIEQEKKEWRLKVKKNSLYCETTKRQSKLIKLINDLNQFFKLNALITEGNGEHPRKLWKERLLVNGKRKRCEMKLS
jgi:hypothetical protein